MIVLDCVIISLINNSHRSIELWNKRKPLETTARFERQIGAPWKPIPSPLQNTVIQYLWPHIAANEDHSLMPEAINMLLAMLTNPHKFPTPNLRQHHHFHPNPFTLC